MRHETHGIREYALGNFMGVTLMPAWCSYWRTCLTSQYLFLQAGRVRFWIRWSYV